jgi:hydroxypyruvate reductase
VIVLNDPVLGEARAAGHGLWTRVHEHAAQVGRPACVIASGETTVRVGGGGKGGRNQELTLAVATHLAAETTCSAFASVGTDGIDGPTDAAGGIADSSTVRRIESGGLSTIDAVLDDNDAYTLLDQLGDLIRTGPTGTNVGDLQLFLLA